MALRLISCSPRSGRARCHRRRRNCFHRLDASIGASGPHDFTVRISTVRQRHIHVHRIPSRACDDRETPLVPGRDEIDILLIWARRQPKFRKIRNYGCDPGITSRREVLKAEVTQSLWWFSENATRHSGDRGCGGSLETCTFSSSIGRRLPIPSMIFPRHSWKTRSCQRSRRSLYWFDLSHSVSNCGPCLPRISAEI